MQTEINMKKDNKEINPSVIGNIILSARDLRKSFGGHVVLDNVSVYLRKGEIVLLRGENGSGKTTLLNILTGNLEPDRGGLYISVNGNREAFEFPKPWWKELNPFDHFTPERLAWEGIGRVWQDIRLFPTLTTLDNVTLAAHNKNGESPLRAFLPQTYEIEKKNKDDAFAWIEKLGLKDHVDASCDKISLGQMKRLAIAMAIQAGAKILFLDEPLSGLDKDGIKEIMGYLEEISKSKEITIVIVEHVFNIPTVMKIASTIWSLQDGNLTITAKSNDFKKDHAENNGFDELLHCIKDEKVLITTKNLEKGAKLYISDSIQKNDEPSFFKIKDITINRGHRMIHDKFSLNLKKGQFVILEAPNGWGKSTLLDAITGLCPLEKGSIQLNEREISALPTYKRVQMGIAYLRSRISPFLSLSVGENKKLAKTDNHSLNGLRLERKAAFLSGGEKQALLIDMLPDANIYLLDEPMIGLDKKSIQSVTDMIFRMWKENKTVIITVPMISEALWQS